MRWTTVSVSKIGVCLSEMHFRKNLKSGVLCPHHNFLFSFYLRNNFIEEKIFYNNWLNNPRERIICVNKKKWIIDKGSHTLSDQKKVFRFSKLKKKKLNLALRWFGPCPEPGSGSAPCRLYKPVAYSGGGGCKNNIILAIPLREPSNSIVNSIWMIIDFVV